MSEPLKVGSTIWYGWTPYQITGETSRSWIIGPEWDQTKLPKKRDPENRRYLISQQELDDEKLLSERWKLAEKVRYLKDASTLRQIAALVGYTPNP